VSQVIVVAGEALVDLVAEEDGRFRAVAGGSPANVAVGLARLSVPTELLARFGTGRFGSFVRDHLAGNDVGLSYAVTTRAPATLAVVSLAEDGLPTYDFYVDGTADWGWTYDELPEQLPAAAVALCTGSLAMAMEPGATALTALMRRERRRGAVTLVFDPNLRPSLVGPRAIARTRLEAQIELVDVVKASDEDLAWVAPDATPEQVAARWLKAGPALVVVTRGADGASAMTRGGVRVDVPAHPVELVDTVGAGDAFTSGMVDALRGHGLLGVGASDRLAACDATTLRAVLGRAAIAAAITCARRGADPPTAAELEAGPATLGM
jgi:fructokinase